MHITTMPSVDDLMASGPGGYIPTPDDPRRIASLRQARDAADDAPSRREIRRHEAAADEAAARIIADIEAIEAQAITARRVAIAARVDAWSAIARVHQIVAIEARRWLHCHAMVAALPGDALERGRRKAQDAQSKAGRSVTAPAVDGTIDAATWTRIRETCDLADPDRMPVDAGL